MLPVVGQGVVEQEQHVRFERVEARRPSDRRSGRRGPRGFDVRQEGQVSVAPHEAVEIPQPPFIPTPYRKRHAAAEHGLRDAAGVEQPVADVEVKIDFLHRPIVRRGRRASASAAGGFPHRRGGFGGMPKKFLRRTLAKFKFLRHNMHPAVGG